MLDNILKIFQPRRPPGPSGKYALVNTGSDESFLLPQKAIKLGRDLTNQLVLEDDPAISREHARILFERNAYWLEDLGSMNGTALNGKRISKRQRLAPGDRITIGQTELVVEMVPEVKEADFGEYEVLSEVARGGMGIIYRARDKYSGDVVAIKELLIESSSGPEQRRAREARFKREATLLKRLHHPNLVAVYDVKLGPEKFYYVMEFLEGRSLNQELAERKRFTPLEFLHILEQVGQGLAYAHAKKVVHRDIKPDNIFLMQDGTVKLTDFGIARPDDIESNLTRSGAMLGTIGYVAPEQLNNARRVDHRADIFSLAVVTYQALAGKKPFDGQGITDVVGQIVSHDETPLNQLVSDVDAGTAAVVATALRKKPGDRYASVSDFVRDYRAAVTAAQTNP